MSDGTDKDHSKPSDEGNFYPKEDGSAVVHVFSTFIVFVIISDLDVTKEDVKDKCVLKNGVYNGS